MSKAGAEDCILLGGEPTLHPRLLEIIDCVKHFQMRAIIVSNGRRFASREFAMAVSEHGVDAVNVSIHGWDTLTYKRLTGSSNGFRQVKQGITNLIECGVNLGTTFVLTRHVTHCLDDVVSAIAGMGVRFVEFNMGAPAVSEAKIDGDHVIPLHQQKDVVLQALHLCKDMGISVGFNLTIPHCLFSPSELKELMNNSRISSGCSMRNGSGIVFKPDGSITTCNHFLDFEAIDKEKSSALLRNGQLLHYWNSEDMNALREEVNCYHAEACISCQHWEACGGGCPINWMHFDPEEAGLKCMDISTLGDTL